MKIVKKLKVEVAPYNRVFRRNFRFKFKKFNIKRKGERKNLSEIYKQQGKRQRWKKKI